MGQKCAEYENIGVIHPANNRFIDVAPRQYVNIVVDGTTLRTIPRRISYRRDDGGQITTEYELEPEGVQYGATNILYPDEGLPPVQPPVIPPEPPPPPPEPTGADAVVVTSDDVRITADLDAGSPTWTSIVSGGPTAPVDSDLPETTNDTLYVIEAESIWKCTGVTGTPAWAEVWTGDSLAEGTIGELTRIRVAPGTENLVYVLGYGDVSGDQKPFVLRSSNGGATWSESWIDDILTEATPYTMDVIPTGATKAPGGFWVYWNVNADYKGDETKPMAIGKQTVTTTEPGNTIVYQSDGSSINSWNSSNDSVGPVYMTPDDGPYDGFVYADIVAYMDDYFGVGNYDLGISRNLIASAAYIRFGFTAPEAEEHSVTGNAFILWNFPDTERPTALDVSRTNNAYVYVGTPNKVFKSTDGGFTWSDSLTHGSNDINVDPQLAGAYYHWAADGSLELVVADILTVPDLDTPETPVEIGLRLQRDLNSGRLWSLKSGTTLRLRNLGTSSDQDTGLSGARGLHAYLGGKLIYLDTSNIYYSADYGVTQALKKGSWSAYGSPINAHLMRTT